MSTPRAKESLVTRANNEISVFDVLEEFFNVRHPRDGRSFKGYCPFAWEHYDGGVDKGFRTYPGTNTAYCFVQHGSLGPVRLIVHRNAWSADRAARWLLEHYGKFKPRDWKARWSELTTDAHTDLGSPTYLVEALHESLSAHPNYPPSGLSPALQRVMESELESLDEIYVDPATDPEAVRAWFARAQARCREVLDVADQDART